jgi:hypothetical protein
MTIRAIADRSHPLADCPLFNLEKTRIEQRNFSVSFADGPPIWPDCPPLTKLRLKGLDRLIRSYYEHYHRTRLC